MTSPCQNTTNNNTIKNIKKKIHQTLIKKYEGLSLRYNSNIIDNIIYNERAHIVSLFKDRLILDDNGEFLKRYYQIMESIERLPKFFEYYDLYSKIFPNYTSLYEGKFFYQNIQKKQKMIDIQEQIELEKMNIKNKKNQDIQTNLNYNDSNNDNKSDKDNKNNVFSTDIINSILNVTNKEDIELLFNVYKDDIVKEEDIFFDKINDIIQTINKIEYKVGVDGGTKNKKNNKKDKKCESTSKKKDNKSHSGKKKINNTVLGNDINNNKFVKLNYFNKSTIRKNTIFNLKNEKKTNNSINLINNVNKINKNDKNYIKIIEHNIFQRKQLISKNHKKNFLHNISNSSSVKRDLSKSKRNSSNNSKKPSESASSFNLLYMNISLRHRIKNFNKNNQNINNNKQLEIKMKNSVRSPYPVRSQRVEKGRLNITLDKKKINKSKIFKTKYTYSSNNIYNSKKYKKSLSNEKNIKIKKQNILKNFGNNNINYLFLQKKNNNIKNNIKKINKRKIIKNKNNIANNYLFNIKSKYKNNTHYIIDSRNYILNDFLSSYHHRKTNITKKNSVNSRSSSRYNVSKSKSKSNKKNNSKNNLFDSNNSNLFKQKAKPKNMNTKNIKQSKINNNNIVNKFNWKKDSRNKKVLFVNKNTSKYKTKIIFQNDSSLKISFLDGNKYKNKKNYSKIFKYISNKNCCSKIQNNYSFNNL